MLNAKKLNSITESKGLTTNISLEVDDSLKGVCFGVPTIKPGENYSTVQFIGKIPTNITNDLLLHVKTVEPIENSEQSMFLKEYANNKSHIYDIGGDLSVDVNMLIAREFYNDTNIEKVYIDPNDSELSLILVLVEDKDEIALTLSRRKSTISRNYNNVYFEITYLLKAELDIDDLPHNVILVTRGI